jgi:hypothetical protein
MARAMLLSLPQVTADTSRNRRRIGRVGEDVERGGEGERCRMGRLTAVERPLPCGRDAGDTAAPPLSRVRRAPRSRDSIHG